MLEKVPLMYLWVTSLDKALLSPPSQNHKISLSINDIIHKNLPQVLVILKVYSMFLNNSQKKKKKGAEVFTFVSLKYSLLIQPQITGLPEFYLNPNLETVLFPCALVI